MICELSPEIIDKALQEFVKPRMHTNESYGKIRANLTAALNAVTGEIKAEGWDEGFEAGATWSPSSPAGVPTDPPRNPYDEEGAPSLPNEVGATIQAYDLHNTLCPLLTQTAGGCWEGIDEDGDYRCLAETDIHSWKKASIIVEEETA